MEDPKIIVDSVTTNAYQRIAYHYNEDLDGDVDDDISYSSGGEDTDSDYGADHEDNADYPDDRDVVVDPGPFRYNGKMFIVSLPCAFMVLTLVGEILLIAVSFGAGLILILDPRGEKKRCVILFILLFVFCHVFTIYSVLPLLWLSFFNLLLIGVVNMYLIMTGALCILQFSYFRKVERKLSLTLEQMLFSAYPAACVVLLTWATSSIVSWEILPYIFLAYGFIYLQMFMVPHTSSFKTDKTEEEDLNILPEVVTLTMATIYCVSPSMLQVLLLTANNSLSSLASFATMLHLTFIMALSLFLTTLMNLRNICEFTVSKSLVAYSVCTSICLSDLTNGYICGYENNGWQHKTIVTVRWVSGGMCSILLYPVLVHYQLSSHFLPWLPAGVALYTVYGVLLSDKKFKVSSLVCLPVPLVLFAYWLSWLPWKIVLDMLFGVSITTVYILLLVNCVLCFTCVYTASYGSQIVFEALLILESTVFTACEVLLYSRDLYPRAFLLITASVILYALHRIYVSSKMSLNSLTICAAIHFTKAAALLIYHVLGTDDTLTVYRCVTLFIMATIFIRVIALDTRTTLNEVSIKEVVYHIMAMTISIMINANPVLHIICIYVLWEQPTTTDIMGLCVCVCGVCILLVGSLHLPPESVTTVRQAGIVSVSLGVLILLLQPTTGLSWSSILQWGDLWSVVFAAFILLSGRVTTLQQIFVCATVVAIFPGIQLAILLYSYDDQSPVWLLIVRSLLYIPACTALTSLLFIFVKFEIAGKVLDRCILYLCGALGSISTLLLLIDLGNRHQNEAERSLPAWNLSLITTAVVSVSLKILSTTQDLLIPLTEDKKEKVLPRLPFIGNVTSIMTFLLACMLCPFKGLLQDVWCCGASLILLCLQKDKRLITNIKQENQIVPTIFSCIAVLYVSGLLRSDFWTYSHALTFLRSFVEIATMVSVFPMFYILWGILWSSVLLMSEQVVVFLLPLNAVYLLYGSSYTSQALGIVGLFSGIWMMMAKLPLRPHQKSDR